MRTKEGLTLRKVGNQFLIADSNGRGVNHTKVYSMNKTAAYLWEKVLDKDFEVQQLVELLCEKYDIDEVTASQDATLLVEEWKKIGLITHC